MMGAIYSKASELFIWLGKQDNNTELAITTIEQACNELESQGQLDTILQTDLQYVTVTDRSGILRINNWLSVGGLLNKPWFTRLWVRFQSIHAQCLTKFRLSKGFFCPGQRIYRSSADAIKFLGGACRL